jgi:hypothetical protein
MDTVVGESEPSLPAPATAPWRLDWVDLVEIDTRLALRTVPVRVRSACLYVVRYSSSAVIPSSDSSLIRWKFVLISCSGHQMQAIILPVSFPSFTVMIGSLVSLLPFTGCISKPILHPDLFAQLICTKPQSAYAKHYWDDLKLAVCMTCGALHTMAIVPPAYLALLLKP